MKIIEITKENSGLRADKFISLSDSSVTRSYALKLFEDNMVTVNGNVIKKNYILKENDNYVIKFDYDRIYPLTDDYEYVYYNGDVYHLSLQERNVLEDIIDNELEEIKVDKNELNVFSNGLLKIIKNNVIVDESASEDIKINILSETELYFDIAKDAINAKVIFVMQ